MCVVYAKLTFWQGERVEGEPEKQIVPGKDRGAEVRIADDAADLLQLTRFQFYTFVHEYETLAQPVVL